MGITETAQYRFRVIADCRHVHTVVAESYDRILQLDELRTAVGSPIRTTGEDQQQTVFTHQAVQGMLFAELIGQSEIRHLFADLRAGLKIVVLCCDELVPEPGVRPFAGRHFTQYFVERVGFGLGIHFLAT